MKALNSKNLFVISLSLFLVIIFLSLVTVNWWAKPFGGNESTMGLDDILWSYGMTFGIPLFFSVCFLIISTYKIFKGRNIIGTLINNLINYMSKLTDFIKRNSVSLLLIIVILLLVRINIIMSKALFNSFGNSYLHSIAIKDECPCNFEEIKDLLQEIKWNTDKF